MRQERRCAATSALLVALVVLLAGCARGPGAPAPVVRHWVAGRTEPLADPLGPPDALRGALTTLLTHGLIVEDSSGRAAAAPGVHAAFSDDRLTWTFHLDPALRYADGTPCASADFRAAIERSLRRADHGTGAWLFGALRGVDRVRAGKPLPPLGLETPDEHTLVLRLTRPEPDLPHRLALPGVAAPWKPARDGAGWKGAIGLGPYRVVLEEPGRSLTLAHAGPHDPDRADTLHLRFAPGAARVLSLLRGGAPDWVWPVPPLLQTGQIPGGYRLRTRDARPTRRLLLVMRADLPPTLRLPARQALAHSLNHETLLRALRGQGGPPPPWFPGGAPYDFPSLDAGSVRAWMGMAKLGISFHARMAYDADGAGAAVAPAMQGQWAAHGIYVGLQPLRGAALEAELLGGSSQLALVEDQPPLATPSARLATLVMPLRGPAVGAARTGWRTREFDSVLAPAREAPPPDLARVATRLDDERVALPIAALPWRWVERAEAGGAEFDPGRGPVRAMGSGSGARRP